MLTTKPAELRMNLKEYLQKAYEGETVVVSRPRSENAVIISEDAYNRLMRERRLMTYYLGLKSSGIIDSKNEEQLTKVIQGAFGGERIPFRIESDQDYYDRIDKSIREIYEGKTKDAKEALTEICSEIENAALSG